MAYSDIIRGASNDYGVPIDIIKSVIRVESSGNPFAVGRAGEKGLMQLMPGTARDLGVTNPFDPAQNIRAGARYLAEQYKTTGNWRDALAKYNGGKYFKGAQAQGYADKVLATAPGLDKIGTPPSIESVLPTDDAAPGDTTDAPWYIEMVNAVSAKLDEIFSDVKDWFINTGSRIVLGIFGAIMVILGIYKLINS